LIKLLNGKLEKHGDLEVEITWEGITREIDSDGIYWTKECKDHGVSANMIFIDADGNSYKERFAHPSELEEVK
jgi:hypothetical protein